MIFLFWLSAVHSVNCPAILRRNNQFQLTLLKYDTGEPIFIVWKCSDTKHEICGYKTSSTKSDLIFFRWQREHLSIKVTSSFSEIKCRASKWIAFWFRSRRFVLKRMQGLRITLKKLTMLTMIQGTQCVANLWLWDHDHVPQGFPWCFFQAILKNAYSEIHCQGSTRSSKWRCMTWRKC